MKTVIATATNVQWVIEDVNGCEMPQEDVQAEFEIPGEISLSVEVLEDAEDTQEFHDEVAEELGQALSEIAGFLHRGFEYTVDEIIEDVPE